MESITAYISGEGWYQMVYADEAKAEVDELKQDLAEAYQELRQQRPTIIGVFNRTVWDKAEHRGE